MSEFNIEKARALCDIEWHHERISPMEAIRQLESSLASLCDELEKERALTRRLREVRTILEEMLPGDRIGVGMRIARCLSLLPDPDEVAPHLGDDDVAEIEEPDFLGDKA